MNKPLYYYYENKSRLHSAIILISCLLLAGICIFSSCAIRPARAESINLTASYYSVKSLHRDGQWKITEGVMANGKHFNDNAMVCANRLFSLGTILRITNLENGKSVVVETADRIGKRFARTRIDLSRDAFARISNLEQGIIPVRIEVL